MGVSYVEQDALRDRTAHLTGMAAHTVELEEMRLAMVAAACYAPFVPRGHRWLLEANVHAQGAACADASMVEQHAPGGGLSDAWTAAWGAALARTRGTAFWRQHIAPCIGHAMLPLHGTLDNPEPLQPLADLARASIAELRVLARAWPHGATPPAKYEVAVHYAGLELRAARALGTYLTTGALPDPASLACAPPIARTHDIEPFVERDSDYESGDGSFIAASASSPSYSESHSACTPNDDDEALASAQRGRSQAPTPARALSPARAPVAVIHAASRKRRASASPPRHSGRSRRKPDYYAHS